MERFSAALECMITVIQLSARKTLSYILFCLNFFVSMPVACKALAFYCTAGVSKAVFHLMNYNLHLTISLDWVFLLVIFFAATQIFYLNFFCNFSIFSIYIVIFFAIFSSIYFNLQLSFLWKSVCLFAINLLGWEKPKNSTDR